MVDFVSEVQEELRKDDYNNWLRKYGPYVLGLLIAVILAAAFWEWKQVQDDKTARATSAAYVAAAEKADEGNTDRAIAEFKAIADVAPNGYAGLSLMRAAELEADKGNIQGSVALLDQASLKLTKPRHSELAKMKAAYILAGQGQYDDVRSRLGPLAEKGQPYEYLARELMGIAAQQSGDMTGAREQFSYLQRIPGVPPSIQARAKQYLSLMSVSSAGEASALETQETPPVKTPETSNEP